MLQDSASTPMIVTMWSLGHHFFRYHDVQFVILCFYFLYQMIELNLAANYEISNEFYDFLSFEEEHTRVNGPGI